MEGDISIPLQTYLLLLLAGLGNNPGTIVILAIGLNLRHGLVEPLLILLKMGDNHFQRETFGIKPGGTLRSHGHDAGKRIDAAGIIIIGNDGLGLVDEKAKRTVVDSLAFRVGDKKGGKALHLGVDEGNQLHFGKLDARQILHLGQLGNQPISDGNRLSLGNERGSDMATLILGNVGEAVNIGVVAHGILLD